MNGDLLLQILNYSNAYVVILDKVMDIQFVNLTLAQRLGFESKEDPIGMSWLDFIPEKHRAKIRMVHSALVHQQGREYKEFTNLINDRNGVEFNVRWFNTSINHETYWTFSFGLPQIEMIAVSESEIRDNFRTAIESDKTMIQSLKEYANGIQESFGLTKAYKLTE
jgi:PAS domain S-box-containing protein